MPERDGYAPGTPSWVDLATPDVDNAARFYGELFGWETEETGTIEETGGYRFFLSGGKKVAGVSPLMQRRPARRLVDVLRHRRRRRARRARDRVRRRVVLRADGRHGRRPHGLLRPPGGGRVRRLAGRATTKAPSWSTSPSSLAWNTLITPEPEDAAAFFGLVFGLGTETQMLRRPRLRDPHARRAAASPG